MYEFIFHISITGSFHFRIYMALSLPIYIADSDFFPSVPPFLYLYFTLSPRLAVHWPPAPDQLFSRLARNELHPCFRKIQNKHILPMLCRRQKVCSPFMRWPRAVGRIVVKTSGTHSILICHDIRLHCRQLQLFLFFIHLLGTFFFGPCFSCVEHGVLVIYLSNHINQGESMAHKEIRTTGYSVWISWIFHVFGHARPKSRIELQFNRDEALYELWKIGISHTIRTGSVSKWFVRMPRKSQVLGFRFRTFPLSTQLLNHVVLFIIARISRRSFIHRIWRSRTIQGVIV